MFFNVGTKVVQSFEASYLVNIVGGENMGLAERIKEAQRLIENPTIIVDVLVDGKQTKKEVNLARQRGTFNAQIVSAEVQGLIPVDPDQIIKDNRLDSRFLRVNRKEAVKEAVSELRTESAPEKPAKKATK